MSKKTKLELTWIGKDHRPKLKPRILLEEADKSHHAVHRVTDRDLFEKASGLTRSEHCDRDFYPIMTPSGKEAYPAAGRSWSRPPEVQSCLSPYAFSCRIC